MECARVNNKEPLTRCHMGANPESVPHTMRFALICFSY